MAAIERKRKFLKSPGAVVAGTAIVGLGEGTVLTGSVKKACDQGPGLAPARPDPAPYAVDDAIYRRFSAADHRLGLSNASPVSYRAQMTARAAERGRAGDAGFSAFDLALLEAARSQGARLTFTGSCYDYRLDEVGYSFADGTPAPVPGGAREPLDGPAASWAVKRAARFLGADLAGIAGLDRRWLYSEVWLGDSRRRRPLELPREYSHVVVLAVAMDYAAAATSPTAVSAAASAAGYARVSAVAGAVATFIRSLGYQAIASVNDTALSVPLAIDAGLGEMSRPGLVVTPEYGARIRLGKVFTDLPLATDGPITFGVRDFCRTCRRCAERCPAACVSRDDEPSWAGPSASNNPGVYKWYVNVNKCLDYWIATGSDCLSCVVECPYNKPPTPWRSALVDTVAPGTGRAWVPFEVVASSPWG
jgi:ferredoxin